ncbi:UNVERIFIED_CONTAM: hypothetical protein Sangu_2173600 [Sesamum angustifolium]|uniref:Transposase MuDR plant domain-containing protein n=1 Tax=Sesamum angustifolium TaxID=2727405 RepID=A0AAW2LFW7_9LAMI
MDDRDSNGEGDEWIAENGEDTGGRGSENESDDENISGEDSENESVGEDSGDELSDYKSDEHCEPNNFSDSEFEDDPLHGSLNRDACTLPCETGQKVKLEKGMVFVDINAFRKVLKEFCIQEGFKVMRMRNEKKRVTAHCSVKDCPWRVHASPLADGVTFQGLVETINEVVPHAINRRCARHIYANFRSQFAGTALKRVWDISGIPCRHAALGISHRREDLDSYCDSRFFKENYMKAYKYSIHPVPDQTFWPHGADVTPTLLPPIIKRMPGRPKKSRRKEQGEETNAIRRSNMVKCKVCNELGHNRRTCPNIQNSGRDSDLHVPLSKLTRKRKTPPLAGRKRKAAVISSSQPPAPAQVSSSSLCPRKILSFLQCMLQVHPHSRNHPRILEQHIYHQAFGGIGVSPHKEIRARNTMMLRANDNETCSQQ